jgi:hypothetical protein
MVTLSDVVIAFVSELDGQAGGVREAQAEALM